ncbi:FMN-dependent NADH-azoreductase [Sphingosinicella rhizophila]|uniref:FMN dependent NADH:quinone oxidoreductase n=1 Tax=Sphingosinicella rhizophila TaxID=3050082 RepID=A0ABU3Q6T7_9SPHN|nr:NAD(P)H-dependent oxidoreductase [Sphingosinicella sp. GR2756]MDT9599114.1 NAD(P)H-dependent oxidoreductase [Sphingosinicella sp. GR2756]
MTKALIIDSAATGEASVSRKLTGALANRLRELDPELELVVRDIGADPVPHLSAQSVPAIRAGVAETDVARRTLALSDALIAELNQADLIVIGAPMYNFGMASTLKSWFDHVLRAGITFRYSEAGPEGLVKGKKAIVVETRAGLYSEGPAAFMDSQEPHLRTLLGFMGIDDIVFVRAEKLAFGPEAADAAIADALAELQGLAERELALAA